MQATESNEEFRATRIPGFLNFNEATQSYSVVLFVIIAYNWYHDCVPPHCIAVKCLNCTVSVGMISCG